MGQRYDPETEAPRLRLHIVRYLPILIVVGLAIHLMLPRIAALETALDVIRGMAWWAVGLAVAAAVLSYMGAGYTLRALVGVTGERLSLRTGTAIAVAAVTVGMAAGGMVGAGAAIYTWTRNHGIGRRGALLSSSLLGTLNTLVFGSLGLAGVTYLLLAGDLTPVQITGLGLTALALVLATAVAIWAAHHRRGITRLAEALARRYARLRRRPYDPTVPRHAVDRLFATGTALVRGGWRRPLLGAAVHVGSDMTALYFFFLAAGHPVGLEALLVGYGLPMLLGRMAFFLPGGVGLVEATMTGLYTGLGVPKDVVVVVVLAYRAVAFWLPMLLGLPLAVHQQHLMLRDAAG